MQRTLIECAVARSAVIEMPGAAVTQGLYDKSALNNNISHHHLQGRSGAQPLRPASFTGSPSPGSVDPGPGAAGGGAGLSAAEDGAMMEVDDRQFSSLIPTLSPSPSVTRWWSRASWPPCSRPSGSTPQPWTAASSTASSPRFCPTEPFTRRRQTPSSRQDHHHQRRLLEPNSEGWVSA